MYFETHAHYDHEQFKGAGRELVKELHECGIDKIVIPAITMESNFKAREEFCASEFPYVFFATGIHPKAELDFKRGFDDDAFEGLLSDKRTVAIKTGLDYAVKNITEEQKEHQKELLRYMIDVANKHNLPIVVHVRDAVDDLIEEFSAKSPITDVEVHCYMYDYDTYLKLSKVGVNYIGIGGAVTQTINNALRDCVRQIPIEKILLETDSPFQRPEGYKEKLNTSDSLDQIAQEVALLKGMTKNQIAMATTDNSFRFFKRADSL